MKRAILGGVLSLVLAACGMSAAQAQTHGELAPESGTFSHELGPAPFYQRAVAAILFANDDPKNTVLARAVVLPSFKPEWVVTVWEESADRKTAACHVELVEAQKNIWYEKTSWLDLPLGATATGAASKIAIRRVSVPLDRATAQAVNRAFSAALLRDARYRLPPDDIVIVSDGTGYHFVCTDRPRSLFMTAEAHSPSVGTTARRLVDLTEQLRDLVNASTASPLERNKLAERLRLLREAAAALEKQMTAPTPAAP